MARSTEWTRDDMKTLDDINQAASVMDDWLGEGGWPVNPEVSMERAKQCLNCQQHNEGGIGLVFRKAVAAFIQSAMNIKDEMNVSVPSEKKLGCCKICRCVLKLKVHVPIQHLVNNLEPDQEQHFRKANCWITTEKDKNEL